MYGEVLPHSHSTSSKTAEEEKTALLREIQHLSKEIDVMERELGNTTGTNIAERSVLWVSACRGFV
jgi:hypothetical protein